MSHNTLGGDQRDLNDARIGVSPQSQDAQKIEALNTYVRGFDLA